MRCALSVAGYGVFAACALLILFAYFGRFPAIDHPLDDAFISYRYAVHTAQGYWLEWNRGEAPSEGFTNLLFVLILAIAANLGIALPVAGLIINTLATLASAWNPLQN